jgi:hypothetical protein
VHGNSLDRNIRTVPDRSGATRELTVASLVRRAAGNWIGDDLDWPPDVFAITDFILQRTDAYRFVVSPPAGQAWPPIEAPDWSDTVALVAQQWCAWMNGSREGLPARLVEEWQILREAATTPLSDVASGRAWRLCQALVTLHAISDQACAGTQRSSGSTDDSECSFGGLALEMLKRTGSMARIRPESLRVLPKYHTAPGGISARSVGRYVCLVGPAVNFDVNEVAGAQFGRGEGEFNILLLPWPLRVEETDFDPVSDSVRERAIEPYGYFEFRPTEPLDLSLVDRLLSAATEHVDMVVLPESAVAPDDLEDLEALLSRHGVAMLVTGLRGEIDGSAPFVPNCVHFGVLVDGQWWHYRQGKHHRWSLDQRQIEQYHLEAVLDPRVRWWESIEIPPRSVDLIELGVGHTIASLVCEDLAQMDEVVDLLRAVGPSMIIALLLDGPQLRSRWTARYAGVLADDPGSAVLTLTSYGMVRRASESDGPAVVALWKDRHHAMREITLDADAQGILLTVQSNPAIRRAADGRNPAEDVSDLGVATVTQLTATPRSPMSRTVQRRSRLPHRLAARA